MAPETTARRSCFRPPRSTASSFGEDFFVDADGGAVDIVRADFSYEDISNGELRMPRGDEGGANAQWIPGGYLPEGIREAVFTVPSGGATGADPTAGGTFGAFSPFSV